MVTKKEMEERAMRLNEMLKEQGAGFSIACHEMWKDNALRPTYTLHDGCNNCSPNLYYGAWYDSPDQEVLSFLAEMAKRNMRSVDTHIFSQRRVIEERIMPRLVNGKNYDDLKEQGLACWKYLDLAVIYYVTDNDSLIHPEEMGGIATVQVTERLLSVAGMTEQEAYEAALHNLANAVDAMTLDSMVADLIGEREDAAGIQTVCAASGLWIVTNKDKIFGAAVLLFEKELFSVMSEKLHAKAAVLPSSVHEVIVAPYHRGNDLYNLLNMVRQVNATEISEKEFLADNVYYYDDASQCVRALV
ncbi:MAG: DUF5688 family protein [Clostridiales bacterium]|nr:DUF5688 family protein [Clostridiales bacterium]